MLIRPITLYLAFTLFASVPCFAQMIQVSTNEPQNIHLNMQLVMNGEDFIDRITVDQNKVLVVDKKQTDIRIKRDSKTGFNKFNALVAYNLHETNTKVSPTRFLYVQCPIVRTTYVTIPMKVIQKSENDKEVITYMPIDRSVLKTEIIDSGHYRFLSLSQDKLPRLSSDFNISGKVDEHFDIKTMCLYIDLMYLKFQVGEVGRHNTLKSFSIKE